MSGSFKSNNVPNVHTKRFADQVSDLTSFMFNNIIDVSLELKTTLAPTRTTKLFKKECTAQRFYLRKFFLQVLVSVATTSKVKCKFHFLGS